MLKRLSLFLVGLFCWGVMMGAAAQTPPQMLPLRIGTQQVLNRDSFNFVFANPYTIDPKRFIFELKPGEKAEDYALVKNASDIPLKFSLYGADGTKTAQVSFALKTKAQEGSEVGKWITFDQQEMVLQPGEGQRIKFSVEIPSGTAYGTYSGGVAAEKTRPDIQNTNIIIAVRIGLRVDVKVTSDPKPVPKQFAEPTTVKPFFQGYFWASLILFLLSAGALAWSYFSEKKPQHHDGHGKHHGHKHG
jgi:hypothetical protein